MNQSRIDNIKENYQRISKELENPANFTDLDKLKNLNQELSEIKEIFNKIEKLEETQKQLAENEEMIKEEDGELQEMANEEKEQLQIILSKNEKELKKLLLPTDPRDKKNIIVEIRAGAGGDESSLFTGELFKMYSRYAEKNGWKTEISDSHPNDLGGFKEVIFEISGKNVFSKLKFEFDLNNDGENELIPLLKQGAGFLAYDKNENDKIDNGSELFGPQTDDGFEELAQYDQDKNNWIDENDAVFNKLKVWQMNEDGENKLVSLLDLNVGAIYLGEVQSGFSYQNKIDKVDAIQRSNGIYVKNDGSGVRMINALDIALEMTT
jgi:hypothetical protein